MTFLRVNECIRLSSGVHRVVMVNESRAYVVPVQLVKTEFRTIGGKQVEFTKLADGISISPTSEVERVRA